MTSYRERHKPKEEFKGHNHPASEKCGEQCPRNARYKGPVRKPGLFQRRE